MLTLSRTPFSWWVAKEALHLGILAQPRVPGLGLQCMNLCVCVCVCDTERDCLCYGEQNCHVEHLCSVFNILYAVMSNIRS